MKKHIILDTDIGGDPDDTFALLLGLNSPEIQIDLIVTSDEHQGHRALFAKKLLRLLNKNIPVVKGRDLGHNKCCVICDLVTEDISPSDYLDKIKRVAERNPKTYYVCIGPQSNLAAFLDYAPELQTELEVVIMGGAIHRKEGIEHNVKYDIGAARKVFNSNLNMRWVISDITANPAIEINQFHPIYKKIEQSPSPIKDLFIKSMQNYFDDLYSSTFMHDPLALSYVIDPQFLIFEKQTIAMDKQGALKPSIKGRPIAISAGARYQEFMKFLDQRLPF